MPINNDVAIAAKKSLPLAAQIWVNKAKPKAKTQKMKNSFEIGQATDEGNGRYSITIQNTAPEFAAYEYGSGLHRTKGSPEKYRIAPKNARALAFEWNPEFVPWGSPKFIAISSSSGNYLFRYVMHPGVRKEAAMIPALREAAGDMARVIGREFMVEVVYKNIRESMTVTSEHRIV